MSKRILTMMLCLALLAGIALLPTFAYAQEPATETGPGNSETQQILAAEDTPDSPAVAIYEQLMAATSLEEAEKILASLSAAEYEAEMSALTAEELALLEDHMNALLPPEEEIAETPRYAAPAAPAPLAASAPVDADGLITGKTATKNPDGSYTISMSAYVTGEVTSTTTTKTTPCDIVLVLDLSGSMSGELNDLKKSVNSFIDSVAAQNAGHRIAVVKFAGPFNDKKYDEGNHKTYQVRGVGWENDTQIRIGWRNAATQKEALKSAVNSLDIYGITGRTYSSYGLELANYLLDSAQEASNKVIVLFTDGNPSYDWDTDFHSNAAHDAIVQAKVAKDNGVKVFCVGMFSGAGPGGSSNANKYLNYVSSNYPNASGWSSPGSGSDKGFYMGSSGTGGLNNMFEKISTTISTMKPAINLNATTVLRDVVTQYFTPPANAGAIRVYTQDCTGGTSANPTFGSRKEITGSVQVGVSGDTVTVSGFDYAANAVTGSGGKKLIVEFTVRTKAGFLGGNGVPTNDSSSGIYGSSGCVENFRVPTVDVPVAAPTISVADKNVYLTGSLTQAQLLEGSAASVGGTALSSLQDWQKAYVRVELSASAKTGLMGDTTYRATLKVDGGAGNAASVSSDGSIFVFAPAVTFRDSTVKQHTTVSAGVYMADNHLKTQWLHGTTAAEDVSMYGAAPTLSYAFSPSVKTLDSVEDLNVDAKISADGGDITNYVTFLWQAGSCTHASIPTHLGSSSQYEFVVHVESDGLAKYTIRYWRDEAETGTSLGEATKEGLVGKPVSVEAGSEEGQLDWKRPDGYRSGVQQQLDVIITADGTAVVDVVYQPIPSSLQIFMHVGGKYANRSLPFSGTASYTGYFSQHSGTLPYSLTDGGTTDAKEILAVRSLSLAPHETLPSGYTLEKIVINGRSYTAANLPRELTALAGENRIDLYYVRQEVPVTGVSAESTGAAVLLICAAVCGATLVFFLRKKRKAQDSSPQK